MDFFSYFSSFEHVCVFACPINSMSKFTSSKFFVFLLILILIGIITAATKESYRKYQIDKEVANLKEEMESLKERNELLSDLLDYFDSEKSLEKEARLKLNLLKEGEKLVIISPDKNKKTDSESQASEDSQKEQVSNFKKWLKYLFKNLFKN